MRARLRQAACAAALRFCLPGVARPRERVRPLPGRRFAESALPGPAVRRGGDRVSSSATSRWSDPTRRGSRPRPGAALRPVPVRCAGADRDGAGAQGLHDAGEPLDRAPPISSRSSTRAQAPIKYGTQPLSLHRRGLLPDLDVRGGADKVSHFTISANVAGLAYDAYRLNGLSPDQSFALALGTTVLCRRHRRDRRRRQPVRLLGAGPDGRHGRHAGRRRRQALRPRRPDLVFARQDPDDDPDRRPTSPRSAPTTPTRCTTMNLQLAGLAPRFHATARARAILSLLVRLPHQGLRLRAAASGALPGGRPRDRAQLPARS